MQSFSMDIFPPRIQYYMFAICLCRTAFLSPWSFGIILNYGISLLLCAILTIHEELLKFHLQTTLLEIMVCFPYFNQLPCYAGGVLLLCLIIACVLSGVRAGIFVRDAKALCPHLVIFPYDFDAYEEVNI